MATATRKGFFSFQAIWLIPALALFTLGLGVWGWLANGLAPINALYRAVVLFDIGNDMYLNGPGSVDWRFQIGRWTGLASVFGAAVTALAAVLQERVALAVARWIKQQVVIIGGDGLATKAFEAARRSGKSVVWLGASTLGAGSIRSIALPWPPEDRARTVLEHSTDADHVLVAHEDDAGALTVIRAARQAAPKAFITVLMRDARLAEDAAANLNEARTRVLSLASVSARALHIAHPPFLIAKDAAHTRIHALIVGFGQTGQAIARDLIVNSRTTFLALPRITIIDPRAWSQEGVMRVRAPEIDACADFVFIEGRIGSEAISPPPANIVEALAKRGPITAVYICLGQDSDALAAAAMLQALLRGLDAGHPPMFVRLRDAQTLSGRTEKSRSLDGLIAFGDLDAVLSASEFLSAAPDRAARLFSEAYRNALPAAQRDDPSNRSGRPWEELDETFRQANRDAVAHIPAKLASAGIDPAHWRGVVGLPSIVGGGLFCDDVELERLSVLEHERWNTQRRMDGWRWGDVPSKDEARRLHPSLVDYDMLTEEVKEYDRVMVREAQQACFVRAKAQG